MRLLLVGTDQAWATTLVRRFAARGHAPEWRRDPPAGLRWRRAPPTELLLLDLRDADAGGLRLLAQLRRGGDATPLLGFTAGGGPAERMHALDQGADDCMDWPCDLGELEARCRAVLRRRHGLAAEVFHHGRFRFESSAHRASIAGIELALPRREYTLLRILVGRFDRVVRKDEIGRLLFNAGEVVGSNAVELYVARLRRRLVDADVRIQTVRGVGYCLQPQPVP